MRLFETITPADILRGHITQLRSQLPAVLDGDTGGVHDARIATRRVRAVFPLVQAVCPQIARDDDLADRIKRVGRALGSIRDLDARLELLTYVEARLPGAGFALVAARHRQQVKRASRTRKLVKLLEELDIERELERIQHACSFVKWRGTSGAWRVHLRRLTHTRGQAALGALTATTAVYFPNRTHKTRIALKKFRYAAEIAAATGHSVGESCMRRLKKAQDALGDLHDRDVLLDELKQTAETAGSDGLTPQLATIVQFVEAEMNDQYRRFVARRDTLVAAVHDIRGSLGRSHKPAAAFTVAAALAVAGAHTLRKHLMVSQHDESRHDAIEPDGAAMAQESVRPERYPRPLRAESADRKNNVLPARRR